jgi:uncharacterized membrane protein
MTATLQFLRTAVIGIARKAKVRKGILLVVAIFLILQMYFVRELLAAEVLFGLGFACLLMLGGLFYAIGTIGERGLDWAEAGIRVTSTFARRSYASLEEISRKPFRHPRSESAQ